MEKAENKKYWMYASYGAIILSIVSLFLPIIIYTSGETGMTSYYNVLSLLFNDDLIDTVFFEYDGNIEMERGIVAFLVFFICLIGVAAVISAFFGIKSMAKQYESVWPFRLAISGLVGTAVPALSLLIFWMASHSVFLGSMSLGTYIFLTPIAMIIACINVTNRHRLTREEWAIQEEASKYIRPAGDL